MALIECAECGSKISDRAASCPQCGAPLVISSSRTRGRRKVGTLIGVGFAAVLVLTGAGYGTWAMSSATAHNEAWDAAVHKAGAVVSFVSTAVPTGDRSGLTFASEGASTCTPAEVQTISSQILHQLVLSGLGDVPAAITEPIADSRAATQCASQKKLSFAAAVADAEKRATGFLSAIGAPDSAASMMTGLRGLDGTQSRTFHAQGVGEVTMQTRYDGSNGLSVTLTREHQTVDWGAPFGR